VTVIIFNLCFAEIFRQPLRELRGCQQRAGIVFADLLTVEMLEQRRMALSKRAELVAL
jgi:hypothetical protein